MHVFRGLPTLESRMPCCLAIGNFDGVHLGHRALLERVVARARSLGVEAAVMTFEPHPREFFAQQRADPSLAPARIANLRDKLEALECCGIDRVVVEHFNARFAAIEPAAFVNQVLVDGCHARAICVGDDFRFGARRAGDIALLERLGAARGFDVETIQPVLDERGERISSSAVRAAIAAGDFERTTGLLGRAYAISGHVTHGCKLGRELGYPTLNLRVERAPPITGIFVVRVHGLADAPLPAVASLGVRPTVDSAGTVLLEPHVLDWSGDAYGRIVRVEFLHWLRPELKFDTLDALVVQMKLDEAGTRAWFARMAPLTN